MSHCLSAKQCTLEAHYTVYLDVNESERQQTRNWNWTNGPALSLIMPREWPLERRSTDNLSWSV